MCIYIYIYIYLPVCSQPRNVGPHPTVVSYTAAIRDFKDTIFPFFESDALFLECLSALFLVV